MPTSIYKESLTLIQKIMNNNDNAESSASQNKQILAWLESGKTLTQLEALTEMGCMRLASRISDLRERGVNIKTEKIQVKSGKYVARYSIVR